MTRKFTVLDQDDEERIIEALMERELHARVIESLDLTADAVVAVAERVTVIEPSTW